MYKNIIITGANSPYMEGLLTLISSIHKHSFDLIDCIVVFDFGLNNDDILRLSNLSKVRIMDIRDEVKNDFLVYETFSSVKTLCHFLKMYC